MFRLLLKAVESYIFILTLCYGEGLFVSVFAHFTPFAYFELSTCVYSKRTALLEILSAWWRNSESLIPTHLSSLSVCLQFHNCWLLWSSCQWAPDASYPSQPGRSSEASQPISPSLTVSSTGMLLLFLLWASRFTVSTPLPCAILHFWLSDYKSVCSYLDRLPLQQLCTGFLYPYSALHQWGWRF